jgi:hypothetical protein
VIANPLDKKLIRDLDVQSVVLPTQGFDRLEPKLDIVVSDFWADAGDGLFPQVDGALVIHRLSTDVDKSTQDKIVLNNNDFLKHPARTAAKAFHSIVLRASYLILDGKSREGLQI